MKLGCGEIDEVLPVRLKLSLSVSVDRPHLDFAVRVYLKNDSFSTEPPATGFNTTS
jgi:hypothetical protein